MSTGTVVSLWRYPVKSMMGEELNAADCTERGIAGDRAYALVDTATGKIVSAKNPRKWPDFFAFRAAFVEPPQAGAAAPPVWITLPDGAVIRSDRPGTDQALSRALGRAVALKSAAPGTPSLEEYWPDIDGLAHRETVTDEAIGGGAPPGTFFDYAPAHLLTTATLDRLRAAYPEGRFEARRFRPNIVVRPAAENGFVENGWVGKVVSIGELRLRVTDPCPRCVMTTLAQGDLPLDSGILAAAARHNTVPLPSFGVALPSVGVYAAVARVGTVRRGDAVAVE